MLLVVALAAVLIVAGAAWWEWRRPDRRLVRWKADHAAMVQDQRQLHLAVDRLPAPPAAVAGPDIVVIVLDTVRADHLGLYGYERETSPRLDAWAREGRVYERMMADSPWTLPSHASLFTGRWPRSHGARGLLEPEAVALGDRGYTAPLAPGTPTVAGALRERGYRTAGIVANRAYLAPSWGLAQGFDLWLCEQLGPDRSRLQYPSADRVTALTRVLLGRERSQPLFLFVNYMDAHSPWVPRRGFVKGRKAIDRKVLPRGARWEEELVDLVAHRRLDPDTRRAWVAAYDSELRFLDHHLGLLLEALPALGIDDQDYVFVLSDHGEYLGEHDLVLHSRDVHEEVLHVPLVVRGPGYAPGRDPRPLQHHDLATMILAAAGLPPLPGAQATADLQVAEFYGMRGRPFLHPGFADRYDRVRRAFRAGDHVRLAGDDGSEELYDLAADPGQLHPLDAPAWAEGVRARAEAWFVATPLVSPAPFDGAVDTEALEALGYVD